MTEEEDEASATDANDTSTFANDDEEMLFVDAPAAADSDDEVINVDDDDNEVITIDDDDDDEIIDVEGVDDDDDDDVDVDVEGDDDLFARLGRAEGAVLQSFRHHEQLQRQLENARRQLDEDMQRYRSMLPPQQTRAFDLAITRNDVEGYIREIATRIRNAIRRVTTWGRGDHEYTRYYPT